MKKLKSNWIALFSQTGSEIASISEALGRWPDKIITNYRPSGRRTISPKLTGKKITYVKNKPAASDYFEVLEDENNFITLHGWLRIIPHEVILKYPNILNGHPGMLPLLAGKDPQEKAFSLNLDVSACVIHRVTVGVDEGPILKERLVHIKDLNLEEVYQKLHKNSIELWVSYLQSLDLLVA